MKERERMRYVPEADLGREGLRKVGVGLFIVDLDNSNVWVVEELKDKCGTCREAGDVTIPLETRKRDEFVTGNVLGGLMEFRPLEGDEELMWVDGISYLGRYPFVEKVAIDLVILGLRNHSPGESLVSYNGETKPAGWMPIEKLRNEPHLRRGVGEILDRAMGNGWIKSFVAEAINNGKNKRMVNRNFDIVSYGNAREKKQDIG